MYTFVSSARRCSLVLINICISFLLEYSKSSAVGLLPSADTTQTNYHQTKAVTSRIEYLIEDIYGYYVWFVSLVDREHRTRDREVASSSLTHCTADLILIPCGSYCLLIGIDKCTNMFFSVPCLLSECTASLHK